MRLPVKNYLLAAALPAFIVFTASAASANEAVDGKASSAAKKHRFTNEEITVDPGPPRWFSSGKTNTYVATMGNRDSVTKILEAYRADIDERIYGPEGSNDTGWRVNVHEFTEDGVVFEDDNVVVEAFRHEHGTLPSFGFRFTSADCVVVWSYHLKPRDLAALATKAKVKRLVLIHESNYSDPYEPEALLKEIKKFYDGDVVSSRDGDIF